MSVSRIEDRGIDGGQQRSLIGDLVVSRLDTGAGLMLETTIEAETWALNEYEDDASQG